MRRTRAKYHYAIRQVRRDEDLIIKQRIADAVNPNRDFWSEVKKIRGNKAGTSRIVDGCTDESSISQLFANKYKDLFSSVPYDTVEMQDICNDINILLSAPGVLSSDFLINCSDFSAAVKRFNAHKNEGTDHFISAGDDYFVHVAFFINLCYCSRLCSA